MSGGGMAHAKGLLNYARPEKHGIEKVYVFSSSKFLSFLPDKPWLVKISHPWLNKSLIWQILWQVSKLSVAMRKYKCEAVLYPDAGAFVNAKPCIVMSRDMLSFESSEIIRFKKTSYMWVRLFILRYVQLRSLNRATLPVFLTRYAAEKIKEWGGPEKYQIINHGISEEFKNYLGKNAHWPHSDSEAIKCVYVSNVALYKHQWNVLEAINVLRNKGYNIEVNFVGGGSGVALDRFKTIQRMIDPEQKFHKLFPFTKNSELPDIISRHHLFIFASSCENMPNTLLEGMALGVPILSSNRGPMPEVLENGGIYFDPEDINSIVDAFAEVIDNECRRIELSEQALALSHKYSWDRCSKETFEALSRLAKTHNI
jgi:glycosyltransferase involved in cell wall biosynthesis